MNRGQRSSSLHYAACFGRPKIVKTLLQVNIPLQVNILLQVNICYIMQGGANPELRDEDGKTPLDKARERNDEGHREVIAILQSPGEYMVPISKADAGSETVSSEAATSANNAANSAAKTTDLSANHSAAGSNAPSAQLKGNIERTTTALQLIHLVCIYNIPRYCCCICRGPRDGPCVREETAAAFCSGLHWNPCLLNKVGVHCTSP